MKTRRFGIGVLIGLGLAITTTQAASNSWTSGGNGFWDLDSRWSLGAAPTSDDSADLITNATSKTVTVDATDSAFFPQELTISNLTVSGAASSTSTNTLSLLNMDAGNLIPLHMLNGLAIGTRGVLQVTNSMLQVDGVSGGTFQLDGLLQMNGDGQLQARTATFGNGAVLQLALDADSDNISVSNLILDANCNLSLSGGAVGNVYTVLTANAFSGTFGEVTPGYTVNYSPSLITVQVVPEPAAIFLAAVGLAGVLALRRRVR
ncbi:MAG TPA: PEP-CTERM sorting domain-containing protein [Verrucomicrobiae bacterium]|nr:PEP-CTERM sorting domain-containing protein [Verrucomicrobiae bacterium]